MDFVVAELQKRSLPYFRLNTELLPQSRSAMGHTAMDDWAIELEGREISGGAITAAYFRRPGAPQAPALVEDSGERSYIEAEWSSFLKSLYFRLEGRWFSDPTQIFLAEDKPRQLIVAQQLGFNIPSTTITNRLKSAESLTAGGRAIGKPLRQAVLPGALEKVMFTSRLQPLTAEDEPALSLAPLIIQAEVLKKYDVRVTVVGSQVFATAIWSQEKDDTEVDWRKGSHPDLRHEAISLPDEVAEQCRELVRRMNLRYGAIDLVCDRDGKLWFLEINPNGQWAWIENQTGYPIAAAIVDELESIRHGLV
jgi:glutathione synthase/RimK-type ligase-like ATP-grasp enzyme